MAFNSSWPLLSFSKLCDGCKTQALNNPLLAKLSFSELCDVSGADLALAEAAARGDEILVQLLHDKWNDSDVWMARAKAGRRGLNTLNNAIFEAVGRAARNGHIKIVEMCHRWDASIAHVNRTMSEAAKGGHIDIMRLCLGWAVLPTPIASWPKPRKQANWPP